MTRKKLTPHEIAFGARATMAAKVEVAKQAAQGHAEAIEQVIADETARLGVLLETHERMTAHRKGEPEAEADLGERLRKLLEGAATLDTIAEGRALSTRFTSCPACGAEPWCDIDCKVCEVMAKLEPIAEPPAPAPSADGRVTHDEAMGLIDSIGAACGTSTPEQRARLRDYVVQQRALTPPSSAYGELRAGSPAHVALWDAINAYAATCGGDPGKHVYGNTSRMNAVVSVESAVRALLARLDAPAGDARPSAYDLAFAAYHLAEEAVDRGADWQENPDDIIAAMTRAIEAQIGKAPAGDAAYREVLAKAWDDGAEHALEASAREDDAYPMTAREVDAVYAANPHRKADHPEAAAGRDAALEHDLLTREQHERIVGELRAELSLFRAKKSDLSAYRAKVAALCEAVDAYSGFESETVAVRMATWRMLLLVARRKLLAEHPEAGAAGGDGNG